MSVNYKLEGPVAVFEIANPPVNAFTPRMHRQLHEHLKTFMTDRKALVGVLTGSGSRIFSAGDDIKARWGRESLGELLDTHFRNSTEDDIDLRPGWEREVEKIERTKPIIAAINGPAFGMGLIYILNLTDIRIASDSARFGFPEIAFGMGGATGISQLTRKLPPVVASWMALTGDPLSAEQALQHSLVNEVLPGDRVLARAMEIATRIASHPPISVRVEMELLQRTPHMSREDAAALSYHLYRLQRAALLSQGFTNQPLAQEPVEPS